MGYEVAEGSSYRCLFYFTLFAGLAAYYELYMRDKVLRYELDIVKELCPQPQK